MNITIIELRTSPNRMKKRPCEHERDDAALLPSVKNSCTDLLGLTGEDKEQSNEQEEDSRDDRKSGIAEGVKGDKNQKSQDVKGGGAEEGREGSDESQQHIEHQKELGNEKEKLERKDDKIKKEKLAQSSSCCKYNHDY